MEVAVVAVGDGDIDDMIEGVELMVEKGETE